MITRRMMMSGTKQVPTSYLTFTSSSGTVSISATKKWSGKLLYSVDVKNWIEWDGSEISGSVLYFAGEGNSIISNGNAWTLTGTSISCSGNIESLLDWKKVSQGEHPTMGYGCYRSMFQGCTSLVTPPSLPATTLSSSCYYYMFQGCTSLVTSPSLPATTLTSSCYAYMFHMCTSLTKAPSLPATTLNDSCYAYMFSCSAVTESPTLNAQTMAFACYRGMFRNCTSLTRAPVLPSTSLAESCYCCMFELCGFSEPPELPATVMAESCYYGMFQSSNITAAPSLRSTSLAPSCYSYMFSRCKKLNSIPSLPATTMAEYCYAGMFDNSEVAFSSTQTTECPNAFRLPSSGNGTEAYSWSWNMFNARGTKTSDPVINTTYYTNTTIV